MKILLIYPRISRQVHGLWAPLGPIMLGTVLDNKGYQVELYDSSFDEDTGGAERRIAESKPDLVGMTVLTEFLPAVGNILKAAKLAGAVTILGGPHPTLLPERTLTNLPDADFCVIGEGETSLPQLLESIASKTSPSAVKGIAYRNSNGEIVVNESATMIENLDVLPVPKRELLPTLDNYLKIGALNVHAVRGCPFKCAFCQPTLNKLFGNKIRKKSPEALADELEATVTRYGVDELFFVDDVFTVSKKWLGEVGEAIRKRKSLDKVKYVVNSRVDIFDEDIARLCKEMGVWIVLFGVENGSQQVLDSLDKGTKVGQSRSAFELCRKYGLKTHAYILLGSPAETRESLKATEELVAEIVPDSVHISIYTPLPGTELRSRMEKEGRLNWGNLDDLDYYTPKMQRNQLPVLNSNVTYDEVMKTRDRILSSRRTKLMLKNALSLASEIFKPGGIEKAVTRYKHFKRMRHYFG